MGESREGGKQRDCVHTHEHALLDHVEAGLNELCCADGCADSEILGTLLRTSRAEMSGSCSDRMDGLEQSCS